MSPITRYDSRTFVTYTTEDGLTSNRVISMLEDREGNLWFGTEVGGVSRYDGQRPRRGSGRSRADGL